jgi:two-component system OmpR family response regulator
MIGARATGWPPLSALSGTGMAASPVPRLAARPHCEGQGPSCVHGQRIDAMAYDITPSSGEVRDLPAPVPAPARARPPARVFLVEDNPVVERCMLETLADIGVSVVGRSHDERGATAWLEHNPQAWDIAIVDMVLAQGSGLGVLRGVLGRSREKKVLIVTNYMSPELRAKSFALGANGVYNKTTQLPQLISLLKLL